MFMYIVNRKRHLVLYMSLFLTTWSFLKYFFFPSDDGVCVLKCLVNRNTEYCRVGKESLLITLGCHSVLLRFRSQIGKYILHLWLPSLSCRPTVLANFALKHIVVFYYCFMLAIWILHFVMICTTSSASDPL